MKKNPVLIVEPTYAVFNDNRLFDRDRTPYDRDGYMNIAFRVADYCKEHGVDYMTPDLALKADLSDRKVYYYSLGMADYYHHFKGIAEFRAFIALEPPMIQPTVYKRLPEIGEVFQQVYLANTVADGYQANDVLKPKLRRLFNPQPYQSVFEPLWSNTQRQRKCVVINGHHKSKHPSENYSKRLEGIAALSKYGAVDLYGRGWKYLSRSSLWWPFLKRARSVMSVYKGEVDSKYETLSQYTFSLCFENTRFRGFVTEKIFDCLLSGTIPIYYGIPDIAEIIPENCFIDLRKFSDYASLWSYCQNLSDDEIQAYRDAGRAFIDSPGYQKFYTSLHDMLEVEKIAGGAIAS